MKKVKRLLAFMLVVVVFLVGCGKSDGDIAGGEFLDKEKIVVLVPDGLPALAISKMIFEKPDINEKYNIEYRVSKTTDELTTAVMKGEVDIAIVPSNFAATVFNKNSTYKIAGTVGNGSLYLVGSEVITDTDGLVGKSVLNVGKGLTPDLVFRAILSKEGINGDNQVDLTYVGSAAELAPTVISGKYDMAILPEPALSNVLAKRNDLKISLNLNDKWKELMRTEMGFPQSTLIVKGPVEDKKFINEFLEEVEESTKWIYDNMGKAGEYSEKLGLSIKTEVIESTIMRSNIGFIPIDSCTNDYNKYFEILNSLSPKAIGGKIPSEDIFYKK